MYQVDDKPETIHLYVVREEEARPSILPVVLSLFTLALLLAFGITIPYRQPEIRAVIRIPAVPLGLRIFTTAITVIPTGVKTYPATVAHGVLSIRNGSIIGQTIPAGFVVSTSGIQVATDTAVYVPGATDSGDAMASVATHGVAAGVAVPAYAINTVIGTSLFIHNPQPFAGGQPAYSVTYATQQDRQLALTKARIVLLRESAGLHYPCIEHITGFLTWTCQFVEYPHVNIPYSRITGFTLIEKNLIVDVIFVVRPRPFPGK